MRRYEEIMILDPDTPEEGRAAVFERVRGLIDQYGGLLVEQDEWGMKKLAYEIRKKMRGYYVRFDFCGTGELVNELERNFRIDERLLKYMTVLLDKEADMDRIREEMAASEAKKAAAEAASQDSKDAAKTDAGEPESDEASDEADTSTSEEASAGENTEEEGE